MNMLEVHAEALNRSNTAYHEFLLYYRNDAGIVYGFVEGRNDPVFYKGLVEQLLEDGWSVRLIVAGDRKRVIDNLLAMDWARFPPKRICFFVDRDLTDYLDSALPANPNLYVTDGYSVENSVVNEGTVERAFDELFGIQDVSPAEWSEIHKAFRQSFEGFLSALMPLMGQILLWTRAKADPYLENIKLKEWFTLKDGILQMSEAYPTDIARLIKAAEWCRVTGSTEAEIVTAVKELMEMRDRALVVRGKYSMWFFVQWILSVRSAIELFCARYKERQPKPRVTLGVENAMALLANRVRIPRSLRIFIQGNYVEYIQGLPG